MRCGLYSFACARTSPIAIPTKNTAMNPTPIMPPFRGGLRLNPRSCWSKSSWSRWFIFQIFENDPYEMGGERCPGSASMVRGSGLSIRRSGDEIPCQRFLQGCQRPGFPHPPAHQIAVSVSFIHWVSDTSTPPRMEPLHDGERGQPRLCRFTHHAKVQCGPVIFVPGT